MTAISMVLGLALVTSGCVHKVVYMEGGENTHAKIEVGMMGGSFVLDGPFRYCSEPATTGGEVIPDSICAAVTSPANE